jgi:hypothetical protein
MARKKKPKIRLDKLDASQVAFIHAKVQSLGSVEAVESFYDRDCAVDVFARMVAVNLFGKGGIE